MAQPYVGEIRMFAGNFAPAGWASCDGQLLPISENETLFQLIGTTYGGDGESTFALPDLRGRAPLHQGNSFILAETGGVESVTLTVSQIPSHNHTFVAAASGTGQVSPVGNLPGSNLVAMYIDFQSFTVPMHANTLRSTGGSQPHDNMQPFLVIQYIISLFGIFPSPT